MGRDDPHRPGRRVEDEAAIAADPMDVYRAWIDPEELVRWFVDRSGGSGEVGGEIVWAWDAYGVELGLEVAEAEEGRRLLLRAVWEDRLTVLEVVLDPIPRGTRLRLVESGFTEGADWSAEYEGTRSGWTNALAHLKLYLERYRGRDRAALDLNRKVDFGRESLLQATRTARGLADWLGRSEGDLGDVATPVRIALHGGPALTGEILSLTDWETALTWEEIEGALTFQAFPGAAEGRGRAVGLRTVTWAPGDGGLEPLEASLNEALGRLVDRI